MTLNLFSDSQISWQEPLESGAVILRGYALKDQTAIMTGVDTVITQAPFRHMITPGGFEMSVAMTNCGSYGWVTDRTGYRYDSIDPISNSPWPPMPEAFTQLATCAAATAGFTSFAPDACLVNRYEPGSRMTLHQDKNEWDFDAPIVSVSLGLPATFLFGGAERSDKTRRVLLNHGDVVVWGGPARLRYHGVLPLKAGYHQLVGDHRINLTFRKAR
ncbi:MAG: oxidative demethylase AlkB [Cyanobacteriota bacterium erpe_2018_sw_39hr_WHONDRS-SW48-000098_B_bin.30]|jgi:alkylated DNA repair protein (DNA oxidative demethylase)|nr:oxidative demethylase AlkB [Cyanobacteriota bacterium erpe_2018_sw_39hr_WHONDRS-SW48-000098_B_bin.30]